LAVETITRFEGRGDSTIIGSGPAHLARLAALLNAHFHSGF